MPWRERYPARYEYELEELAERGLEFVPDPKLEARHGLVVLRGSIQWRDKKVDLVVVLPQTYPHLRPEVYAPALQLRRHQNPFGLNLCLLDRDTSNWRTSDTVAWLVDEQVPLLLSLLEKGGEELAAGEAPQGEPATAFFEWRAGTVVFIPAQALEVPHDVQGGVAQMRLESYEQVDGDPLVRALLTRVSRRGARGKIEVIAKAERALTDRFSGTTLSGRWVRLARKPGGPDGKAVLDAAVVADAGLAEPEWQSVLGSRIDVVGVVFSEEVTQGTSEDAWLFAVRFEVTNGGPGSYVTHGQRLTEQDMLARIPTLAGLRDKTVGLVGLGTLGAPLALELARAQLGELRVLDHDRVEVGTTVRWPFGLPAVGCDKVSFIADAVAKSSPFTMVVPIALRIGTTELLDGPTEMELLDTLLEGADLVIDASAQVGVQHVLSGLAGERNIPQIYASGTEGGFGGLVARVSPGATGCWVCLQHRLMDGSIPTPPYEKTGTVQPRGCATRTFTGAGFDMLPIIAQTVRLAVQALLCNEPDGYPGNDHDVFVVSIRTEAGPLPAPHWASFRLDRHPSCLACNPTGL